MMRRLLAAVAIGAACVGCSHGPAPDKVEPAEGWTVIRAPDDFGDVAVRCVGQVRVIVAEDDTRASSAVAAVLDPLGCQS